LVTSFLRYERIETTEAKGKEIRSLADQMITLGKRGDLHARRQAAAYLFDRSVVTHLFSEIAPRFVEKQGGYTRLIKTRVRYGDGAPMVILELSETQKKVLAEVPQANPAEASPASSPTSSTEQKGLPAPASSGDAAADTAST
jgi:large subunit ribosomal protein L17